MLYNTHTFTQIQTTDHGRANVPRVAPMFSDVAFQFDGMRISWGQFLLVVVLTLVAIRVFSRREQADVRPVIVNRNGWGLGRFILLVIVGLFIAKAWSASNARSARDWAEQERKQAEHDRREVERARAEVGARDHVAVTASPTPFDVQTSIEQLWEKLNQPKIDLHAGDQGSPMKVVGGPTTVEMTAACTVGQPAEYACRAGDVPHCRGIPGAFGRGIGSRDRPSFDDCPTGVGYEPSGRQDFGRYRINSRQINSVAGTHRKTSNIAPAPTSTGSEQPVAITRLVSLSDASESTDLNEKIGGEIPTNKPRPAWVEEPQKKVGNVLRLSIPAGPYATPEECYQKTDELLKIATDNYVKHYIGGVNDFSSLTTAQDGRPNVTITNFRSTALDGMGIDLAYIRREIAKDEYLETVQRSVGPMKNLYTLLEFSPDIDRELRARWDEYRRGTRLAVVGLLSGSVIGVIGLAFGLLRIDTATKGYYSKRLFLGVPAMIIAAVMFLGMVLSYRP